MTPRNDYIRLLTRLTAGPRSYPSTSLLLVAESVRWPSENVQPDKRRNNDKCERRQRATDGKNDRASDEWPGPGASSPSSGPLTADRRPTGIERGPARPRHHSGCNRARTTTTSTMTGRLPGDGRPSSRPDPRRA